MNLFIQIENDQPINHPAFENNLIEAFGNVPDDWAKFIRVKRPLPGLYEVLESDQPIYQKIDGIWTDVWLIRPMTEEEIATIDIEIAAQQELRDVLYQNLTDKP